MKNSAVKLMLKEQFNWNMEDFIVICHGFYNGEYNYEAKHSNGIEYQVALRHYETTPFNFSEYINDE